MDSLITLAESKLLTPGGLAPGDLERVFSQLMGPSIDAADLYFQHSRSESWTLEEGIVKDGSHSIEQGVGVRAISGEKTGFAYSDEIVLPQLLEASKAARAIAQDGRGAGQPLALGNTRALYPAIDPVESLPNPDKIALLREVDAYARSRDPRIAQVIVSMAATIDTVLIAASDGTRASVAQNLFGAKVTDSVLGTFSINDAGDTDQGSMTVDVVKGGKLTTYKVLTPSADLVETFPDQ